MLDQALRKAVFLDRDGTITVDTEFSVDPSRLEPLPGAIEGLRMLQAAGYLLIVVTNQSGVARGFFDEAGLNAFHDHMVRRFAEQGVSIAAVYYCPHYEQGRIGRYTIQCLCRKPAPGMLLRAAQEHRIDLTRSWMIGDRDADVGAGRAAGCRTIRVGAAQINDVAADFHVRDLAEAAEIILRVDKAL